MSNFTHRKSSEVSNRTNFSPQCVITRNIFLLSGYLSSRVSIQWAELGDLAPLAPEATLPVPEEMTVSLFCGRACWMFHLLTHLQPREPQGKPLLWNEILAGRRELAHYYQIKYLSLRLRDACVPCCILNSRETWEERKVHVTNWFTITRLRKRGSQVPIVFLLFPSPPVPLLCFCTDL